MTEYRLDDNAAGLVLCMVCVSRHQKKTTYESVMKALADSRKRKAGGDQHPDAPCPKTTRRRHEPAQVHEMEPWLLSHEDDTMPAGAADDSSVAISDFEQLDPAVIFEQTFQDFQEPLRLQDMPAGAVDDSSVHLPGFSDDILRDVEEFGGALQQDYGRSDLTFEDLQELQDIERWLLSDQDDVMFAGAAVDDGRVDPAGILDAEELCRTQQQRQAEDDDTYEITCEDLFREADNLQVARPAPAEDDGRYEEVSYQAMFGDDDMDVVASPAPAEDDSIYEEVAYEDLFRDDDMDVASVPAPAPFVSCGGQPLHACTTPRSMVV
jgi:hypothetical protein